MVIGRQGHPAFRDGLDRAAYSGPRSTSRSCRQVGRGGPLVVLGSARGTAPGAELLVPHYLTIPAIVASTELLGTVPRRLARRFAGSHGLQLADVPFEMAPVQVNLIWHRQQEATPGLQWRPTAEQIVQIEQG